MEEYQIEQRIQIDFSYTGVPPEVYAKQYDSHMRVVAVDLYNNGQPYVPPPGYEVNIRLDKKDGHHVYNPALFGTGNTVFVILTQQMLTHPGKLLAELEVVQGGNSLKTATFVIVCARSDLPDDEIQSTDEYKTIQEIYEALKEAADILEEHLEEVEAIPGQLEDIKDLVERAETAEGNAASSAEQAKNSEDAASSAADAASNAADAAADSRDKAKCYAELASQIVTGSKGWFPTPEELEERYPLGEDGWWAIVGATDTIWVWDSDESEWKDSGRGSGGGTIDDTDLVKMDGGADIILEGDFPPVEGRHEIEITDELPQAGDIGYLNNKSGLDAATMQEAVDELAEKVKEAESGGLGPEAAEELEAIKADIESIKNVLNDDRPKRYGYRIKISEEGPYNRVEYILDAEGMTPAHMDYSAGKFEYGDMADLWFVKDNYPCMVKSDGTEDYRLDPDNYDLKEGGGDSDVSNTAYDGNAMSAIPLTWVNRYQYDGYQYVIFCETQCDINYKAYAHTKADGSISKVVYHAMFKGSMVGSKLRSIAGVYPQNRTTAEAERTAAKANGDDWEIRTWSIQSLIADLCTFISKSTNSQEAFGYGVTTGGANNSATHYGFPLCGSLKNKGQFYGYNDETHDAKVFHIEGFWGVRWDRIVGLIMDSGVYKAKMTPEGGGYNLTGDGYTPIGPSFASVASSGEFQMNTVQTAYGRLPAPPLSGTESTYETDKLWYNNGIVVVAIVGGACGSGSACGARCLDLITLASGANWALGASLSLQGPSFQGVWGSYPPKEDEASGILDTG